MALSPMDPACKLDTVPRDFAASERKGNQLKDVGRVQHKAYLVFR